jgi:hypothetical protein
LAARDGSVSRWKRQVGDPGSALKEKKEGKMIPVNMRTDIPDL